MSSSITYVAIREALNDVRLIDTHEHIPPESKRLSLKLDFTYLLPHYVSSDLVSAGMSADDLEAIRTPGRQMREALRANRLHPFDLPYAFPERLPGAELPLDEKWHRFAPYWARMRNTGYARCLLIAVRDLFGFDDLNETTYAPLSEALQASNRKGWYHHVLQERAAIDRSVNEVGTVEMDTELFAPSVIYDAFIDVRDRVDLQRLEARTNIAIESLNDLVNALQLDMARRADEGMVAVKTALAYYRMIDYGEATHSDAERAFNRLFRRVAQRLSYEEAKPLQDYMLHQVIRNASEQGLPIQVHTGMQEGTGNFPQNANPTLLANLFLRYPRTRFDVFHAGYPYTSELAVLAKNFPNVYPDMAWVYMISPWVAARVLHEWLETVPVNKILGFGGDWIIVEGAYGHAQMAREVVARVLAEKVDGGYCTREEAIAWGRMVLRENAQSLFGL